MQIKREYDKSSSPDIWGVVVSFIKINRQFKSVTGIKYIAEATTNSINSTASQADQDGFQYVNVKPENIELIDYNTP